MRPVDRPAPPMPPCLALPLLACAVYSGAAIADEALSSTPPVDKSAFHLFNPTPRELLRQMTTDSAGTTESPYTVDAGHFQFEVGLLSYSSDTESSGGVTERVEAWAIAPITLKVGLRNRLEAQVVLEPYNIVHERVDGTRTTRRGFGDTTLRLKCNVWGNDEGRAAFAAMPYVKIPTNQDDLGNNRVEAGLILPMEAALPWDIYMNLTASFDALRDEDEQGFHMEFSSSIAAAHEIFGDLIGYVDFSNAVSTERGSSWWAIAGAGVTFVVTADIQLDAGVSFGLTSSADDWSPFLRLSWRV